jgi:hypothetical protein
VGDSGGGHDRGSDHVGVERAPPRLGCDVDETTQRSDADALNLDERVDPAESIRHLVDGSAACLLICDVTCDGQGAGSGLLCGVDQSVEAAGQESNGGTALTESHGNGSTETARGPHDDRSHWRDIVL